MNATTLLTTAALAAALAPAAASAQQPLPLPDDAAFAVPAGTVERTVTRTEVSGTGATASRTRHTLLLGRDRAHSVVVDMTTGRITAETLATPTEVRRYDAGRDRITIERRARRGGLPFTSQAFEAAVQEAYLEQGITRATGERTVRGRRALVTVSVPERWRSSEPQSTTTAVVDAETHRLLERTTTTPDGSSTQREVVERTQTLEATSSHARMKMHNHPGAEVRRIGYRR
jgi:hypothetical protein